MWPRAMRLGAGSALVGRGEADSPQANPFGTTRDDDFEVPESQNRRPLGVLGPSRPRPPHLRWQATG